MKTQAIGLVWLIFYLLSGTTTGQNDEKPNIVIFQEMQQTDLNSEFDRIFSDIGNSERISFDVNYVQLDRDQPDQSFGTLCSFLSSGVSLLIDITWDPAWPELTNFLRSTNVPYIHADVTIRPFARAFFKFIEYTDTHDVAMIFQNEKEQYEGIYEVLNQYSIRSISFDGLNKTTADRIIKMRPMPSNFIIFARPAEMAVMFENAITFKVIERFNRWRLFYLDFVDTNVVQDLVKQYPEIVSFTPSSDMCCIYLGKSVSESCDCNGKITLMGSFIRDLINKLVMVLRVDNFKTHLSDCSSLTNGSSDLSAKSATSDPNGFEVRLMEAVTTSPSLTQFYQNSTYNLEYFLKIMVFGRDGNEFRMPTDESVVLTELAMIDNAAFSITPNVSLKSPRRFFRIGVAQAIPWSYVKIDPKTSTPLLDEKGNMQWDGYCIDFAERLSEKLDFDYVLVPPTHGLFGDRVPGLNNTWDGLVGDLVTGQIDIAVAPMKMTAEREEVIDFVAPYYEQTGILIVIRKPVRQTSLFKFMTVLRVEVWLSIVGAIITTSIMLWLLDKYSPYSGKNNKDSYPYPCREFTFKESLWFSMTSFTPQGGGEAPKSLSSRTLVAAYWLFVVLMLATFTANLAAFLTVERMQTPVQSLDQLARQSRINYTVVEGSDTHKYFINMKFAEDTLYRMWKELTLNSTTDQTQYRVWDYPIKEQYGHILLAINSSNPVANATQGFQNVKDHINADYAFIHDSAEVKYEISRSCELIEVGEVFAEQPYALAIQQGSQLQDELSRAILELQKDRFFEALTAKYWNHSSKADECPNNDESEGITLESLGGVFIATLFGLALAMVTLVIEVVYYRRRDARENAVQPISGATPPPSYDDQHVNPSSKKMFRLNESLITLGGEKFIPAAHSQRTPYNPPFRRRSIRSAEEHEYIE